MITVCAVLYNSGPFLKDFFDSLISINEKIHEIIFFDNKSTDNTLSILTQCILKTKPEKKPPNIEIIRSYQNVGYAKAVNICISKAKNTTVLLLNPNSIVDKAAVQSLLSFYRKNPRSLSAGRYIEYKKDTDTQPSAVASASYISCILQLTNLGKIFPFSTLPKYFWETETNKPKKVVGVTAGFTVFSKKLFEELGGFDEHFFMYLEDLDFCIRAKTAGYSVQFYPQATIRHFGGGSSKDQKHHYRPQHWITSRQIFFKKHFSLWQYGLFKAVDLIERFVGLV